MSCEHLDRLEDREILRRLEALVRQERATTVDVLLHLGEVERRKLHLSLGYGSLFDYATKHLHYSSSAAGRRIQAARCVRRYPQALQALRRDEINLTTLAIVSRILTPENAVDVLKEMRHKTQREVEALVARLHPTSAIRDVVRPVFVHKESSTPSVPPPSAPPGSASPGTVSPASAPPASASPGSELPTPVLSPITSDVRSGSDLAGVHSRTGSDSPPRVAHMNTASSEQRFLVRFAAGPEFMAKLEQARALLSNRHRGNVPLEAVFETALDLFLERHSPIRRKARREERGQRSQINGKRATKSPVSRNDDKKRGIRAKTRHIPADLRDEVYARDDGRCTYVGESGQRCGTRFRIEIDHIQPFELRGPTVASNLRLLCAAHNALEAERVYGTEHMIAARGSDRKSSPATPGLGVTNGQRADSLAHEP